MNLPSRSFQVEIAPVSGRYIVKWVIHFGAGGKDEAGERVFDTRDQLREWIANLSDKI